MNEENFNNYNLTNEHWKICKNSFSEEVYHFIDAVNQLNIKNVNFSTVLSIYSEFILDPEDINGINISGEMREKSKQTYKNYSADNQLSCNKLLNDLSGVYEEMCVVMDSIIPCNHPLKSDYLDHLLSECDELHGLKNDSASEKRQNYDENNTNSSGCLSFFSCLT